jgi:ABC-type lipoprotein export system ATPase subunit
MDINELIIIKSFDEALHSINELYGKKNYYRYYKYKTIFYTAQSCYEEAVSYAKEMRKHCNSPFEILEFYVIFANLQRIFHFKEAFEISLTKYSSARQILGYFEERLEKDEANFLLNLDIQYLQLRIDDKIVKSDTTQRDRYIERLLIIAPADIKLQYQLLTLTFEDLTKTEIKSKLSEYMEIFEQLNRNKITIERYLIISDLLASHLIFQEEFRQAETVLIRAKDKAGNHMLDISKAITTRLLEVYYALGKQDLVKEGGEFYTKTYINNVPPKMVNDYPAKRRLIRSEYLIKGENLLNEDLGVSLSIHIYPGELISIRGPKGSGKTTLMNYLLGIDHPDEGEIYFQDTNIGDLSVKEMNQFRNENMCFLIEGRVILPQIYSSHIAPFEFSKFVNNYPETIKFAMIDLNNYMQTHELDGLSKFYNDFLEAISHQPKLIVMNEPFANIHGETLEKLFHVLKLLTRYHNFSIIIETHHTKSSDYTDCQYFMRDNKIVEVIEALQ